MVVVVDVVDDSDTDTMVKGRTFSHTLSSSSSSFPSAAHSSIRLSSSPAPFRIARPLDADAMVVGDKEDDVIDHVKSPPRKKFVITLVKLFGVDTMKN